MLFISNLYMPAHQSTMPQTPLSHLKLTLGQPALLLGFKWWRGSNRCKFFSLWLDPWSKSTNLLHHTQPCLASL